MHKLSKPTLLEDDDDDISGFGTSSNRFLKTNKQETKQKDNFQLELDAKVKQRNKSEMKFHASDEEMKPQFGNSNRFMKRDTESSKRVTPTRTPTPRSIATDSDVADDSGAESLRMSGKKMSGIGDSGWQPALKKSPRSSLFDDHRNDSKQSTNNFNSTNQKSIFDRDSFHNDSTIDDKFSGKSPRDSKKGDSMTDSKWNKPQPELEDKKKGRIYDDDEDDDKNLRKSPINFMKTGKQSDDKNQKVPMDKSDSVMRPKPRTSKLISDQNNDQSFSDTLSSKPLKTTKKYDFYEKDKDDSKFQPKSSHSKFNLSPDDNDEDSFNNKLSSSSRFLKSSVQDPKGNEKQDFFGKSIQKNTSFNLNDEDEDSFHQSPKSSLIVKSSKIPDPRDKERYDFSGKPFQKKSNFNLNSDDEDNDSFLDRSSQFLKTSKFNDSKIKEKQDSLVKPKSMNSKFNLDSDEKDEDKPFSSSRDKPKEENNYFPKPQKRESKSMPRQNDEEQIHKASKFFNDDKNDFLKSDPKQKPRNNNDDIFSKPNSFGNDNDFKRRSIRFEDEMKPDSGRSSRDASPRKSTQSKAGNRQSRSPSPVTSVCEEYELDPEKQKLEKIKQRRQERERRKETTNMNTEHRIAVEAIHAVEDGQSQRDPPVTVKKKVVIPLSKKYQNVPSKITTKPNMRSVSMDHLNNILTNMNEPNTDRNFSTSQAIREAAYMEWYTNKLKELKEKKKDAPVEEKETKEKRNEQDVKATYDAWLAKKKEYFLELKKKKEDEKSKLTENKENKGAKDNTFELWKKLKDEEKKKESERQKNELLKTEKQKIKEAEEKKEELRKKNIEWEKRQINDIKKKKEKEEEEKRSEQERKSKAEEKQMQAEMSYKTWEEKMDENQQKLALFSKRSESLVQARRAWRPSSNTVATGK